MYSTFGAFEQIAEAEPKSVGQKLWVHFNDVYNICDVLAISFMIAGIALRFLDKPYFGYGKVLYTLANSVWWV